MKLRDDPILDEIHAIRRAHAARINYDVAAIFEDIKASEAAAAAGRKIVRLPRRPSDGTETKRVNFQLSAAQHSKLKIHAAKQGRTIEDILTEYVASLPE